MLQEILLSLSGVPSPIWEELRTKQDGGDGLHVYISPPEQAVLTKLSHLSQLHIEVRESTAAISLKHRSLVCRAVSSAIASNHLAAFRRRTIEVESSVLRQDAAYVGAYQIVPLSTIIADFDPWTRRMDMLHAITQLMKGSNTRRSHFDCTSAAILNHLEKQKHTGRSDLEEIATHLLVVAQSTWMRSVSAWILYGQLPSPGAQDFMIQLSGGDNGHEQCKVHDELIPKFVTHTAVESILAIGNALRQIASPEHALKTTSLQSTSMALLAPHLEQIRSLEYPLNPAMLEAVMVNLNHSVSENALSYLLPPAKVIQICRVIQEFMLLQNGEFAVSLIANSDERVAMRQKSQGLSRPVRKLGRLDDLVLKDVEIGAILSKTWTDLANVQGELEDDLLESATQNLRLRLLPAAEEGETPVALATLLPAPAVLDICLSRKSPWVIFLSAADARQYSRINAFLLSIRRSQLRLCSLWKSTGHRRCHPTPLGPPMSSTAVGRRACEARRMREEVRSSRMRRFWSSTNTALFVLNEINAYLHGEVIYSSWKQFETWLKDAQQLRPSSSTMPRISKNDPRTLARAHSQYLAALVSALLLDNKTLIETLRALLETLDHFIALFGRLLTIWEGLDLQEDDGVVDTFTNFAQDERDVMAEMQRSRREVDKMLEQLIGNIKDAGVVFDSGNLTGGVASLGIAHDSEGGFIPWRARTLDRLIMKLDFLHRGEEREGGIVDELDYE